jgi:aspartyl-tRNA(Asn)/glutamyl-tRNA(Gln) amidotransferase subunit C
MKLSNKEIKHIAELSRLELSAAEEEKFGGQLSSILDYVETLSEADTSGVLPTAFVGGLNNIWRQDEIKPWPLDEIELALEMGETEDGLVKVKRVL